MTRATRRLQVTGIVDAPAGRVFAFLTRPDNHVALDTSGMVRSSVDHATLTAVDEVFAMNMYNTIRGHHRTENHVVVFEPDRAIGWAPAAAGETPAGHTFVWRLDPVGEQQTAVSQTYDWSGFTHLEMLDHLPVIGRDQLQSSLDLLAEAVEELR